MKSHFTLLWGALCLSAPSALAQNGADEQAPTPGGLQFPPRQIPFQLAPDGTLRLNPTLPELLDLNPAQAAGTRIRVLQTNDGEIYQLEVVRQNVNQVLQTLAATAGVSVVVDPKIKDKPVATAVFRGRTPRSCWSVSGRARARCGNRRSAPIFSPPSPLRPL